MKCAIFEDHSSSCAVYSRFSGTLFPVSMIDGDYMRSTGQLQIQFRQVYKMYIPTGCTYYKKCLFSLGTDYFVSYCDKLKETAPEAH